ncbi:hypothetical protein BGY98DRAFT_986218 [Russula aff. rugulosa BPL654]|nr:hypothetical protein BGY98DRAFT_986218 [Russula aff. rugulosa BPL654]
MCILVSHDLGPLTVPFPIFLTFGFSDRYPYDKPLFVTLYNILRPSIFSERRLYLILYIT